MARRGISEPLERFVKIEMATPRLETKECSDNGSRPGWKRQILTLELDSSEGARSINDPPSQTWISGKRIGSILWHDSES